MFRYFLLCVLSSVCIASNFSENVEETFAAAKKENKPILIDFYGIWCPPCNQLDETVFESTGFIERAKNFKLLKVDADAQKSWQIKDRYKVGGYPTIVFTTSEGKEIYRIVGYRTPKEFYRIMDFVLSAKGKSMEMACKSKDDESLWQCALVCSERKDHACAKKAFSQLEKKLKPGSVRYEQARTYFVDNADNEDLKRNGYEGLMKEFPQSPMALLWALSYLDLFEAKPELKPKTEILEKVVANYPAMVADPRLDETGLTKTDLLQIRAALLEKTNRSDEARKVWAEAAAVYEKLASELPKSSAARGFNIERIYCLEQAGEKEAALKLAKQYSDRFPKEFTFHYAHASVLERMKKYTDALPIAKLAYANSYGDNKIRAAILLTKLYSTVPDQKSAKLVVDEVRSEIKPDQKLEVRTHRYLKQLNQTWEKSFPGVS